MIVAKSNEATSGWRIRSLRDDFVTEAFAGMEGMVQLR
jgi:hypothetical protein